MKQPHGTAITPRAAARKPTLSVVAKGKRAAQPAEQASEASREEVVRRTAFGFYEARGRVDGHELEDWLKAEAEVAHTQLAVASAEVQLGQ
jgi:hypothetical protein